MNHTTTVTAGSLEVPTARLHYEVRGHGPLVMLAGAPMDASAFAPLADLLAVDHTVLTTDPRGSNRSPVDDPHQDSTPQLRADDLSRLLTHLDAGPAVVFGSSGGAVSALALVQARPEQVRTVVAHEPPLDELLEDRDQLHAQTEDIIATHLAGDVDGAWAKFLALAGITLPEGAFEQMFGGDRDPQQVADEHFFSCTICARPPAGIPPRSSRKRQQRLPERAVWSQDVPGGDRREGRRQRRTAPEGRPRGRAGDRAGLGAPAATS